LNRNRHGKTCPQLTASPLHALILRICWRWTANGGKAVPDLGTCTRYEVVRRQTYSQSIRSRTDGLPASTWEQPGVCLAEKTARLECPAAPYIRVMMVELSGFCRTWCGGGERQMPDRLGGDVRFSIIGFPRAEESLKIFELFTAAHADQRYFARVLR